MHELPYTIVSTDILIPHPGLSYALTIDSKHDSIETKDITIASKTYKNAFVIVLLEDGSKHTSLGALCSLTSVSAETSVLCSFKVLQKVEILNKKKKSLTFDILKNNNYSLLEKKEINNLIDLILSINFLNDISSYINLSSDKYKPYFLEKILSFLSPTIKEDLSFFKCRVNLSKIRLLQTIINSEVLITSAHPHHIKSTFPTHIKDLIKNQKIKLNTISPNSSEYSTTLDYIELLESLPWSSKDLDTLDLSKVKASLNDNHYGLKEIKDLIIDHVAYEAFTGASKGLILLFDGPPGTGKTTLAKSLAKALGRDFISLSLAGVSDEADIRGHRKSYVSSRPGRILHEMKKINSNNPVILLDEIDKVSSSKGNVASALLELLDPNQNFGFLDKFLEVPYDLSNVIFICTCNDYKNVSKPLYDRLEKVTFRNYTVKEKQIILEKFILKKHLSQPYWKNYNVLFKQDIIDFLIRKFNLRDLEKIVLKLIKRICFLILTTQKTTFVIDEKFYLSFNKIEKEKKIGFT